MINLIKREIYEVTAKVVDAANGYNNLTGYPKSFDSHQNNDDLEKTYFKARAAYNEASAAGNTAAATWRPLTVVSLIRVNDGRQLFHEQIGKMPDIVEEIPDPEPEPEPSPEPEEDE